MNNKPTGSPDKREGEEKQAAGKESTLQQEGKTGNDSANQPGNGSAELLSIVRSLHTSRLDQLRNSHLTPDLNSGYTEINETFFYAFWCSNETQDSTIPLIQQIITGSEPVMRQLIASSESRTYCVLTTSNQYTIAGPLWAIALMHAFYGNKAELIDPLLSDTNLNEKITAFCPLESDEIKRTYMAQPLGAVMLISTAPVHIKLQTFNLLLEKIPPKTSIAWEEFSTALKKTELRSGALETLLLEKMIMLGKTEFAVALIKRNPALLKENSMQGSLTLLELLVKKDQFQILETLTTDNKPLIEVIDETVPELLARETNGTLSEQQKQKLRDWQKNNGKLKNITISNRLFAVAVTAIAVPLSFLGAIAFSGVGEPYIKNMLADAGIPTGSMPATIAVLVVSAISVVLTERAYGLIDKQTMGSFILSAIIPAFPGVPGGPRIQDSLGIVDRPKAIAEAVTTLVMCSIVGLGMLLINQLPKWSTACAAVPTYHLIAYVTVAATVLSAIIIPPICKALYDVVASEGKGKGK